MDGDIKDIYSDKSKDYIIEFQQMILEITFEFMNITQENYDERVNHLLESIGLFFEMERTYLFSLNYKNNTMIYSHEWCNDGVDPLVGIDKEIPLDIYPWWLEQLNKNNIIHVEDVNLMPPEASVERKHLRKQGIKSIISVPISVDGQIEAYIDIDSVKFVKTWSAEDIKLIHIMAKILSKGITQINHVNEISFMLNHDLLTSLPNRLLLTTKLEKDIEKTRLNKQPFSLLFINLDGFKRINDTLGYHQGNDLLKQAAERLRSLFKKEDIVYRTDGDQFILYLRDYQNEIELDFIVVQVMDIFTKAFVLRGEEYVITASMGLSEYPIDGEDVELLLENAYTAMHLAKKLGKNQYQRFTEKLRKETYEDLVLTNDLYHAIEKNQLTLYYQPQVDGKTGEILSIEALLRWNHPEFGFVSPFKFIPIAEKTRLILPIGQWVLETACAQLKEWQSQGCQAIKLGVNFSAHQLNHPKLMKKMEEVFKRTAIDPKYLEIEITESVAIDYALQVQENLERIKDLGISLSIDDYGQEYSSMRRLKEDSIDALKIDMSYIQGIGINPKDEIIVKSILLLAHDLGLETVAEGVETKEQVNFLNKTSCD